VDIHIGCILAVFLGLLAGYYLYSFLQYKKVSDAKQILYFILPSLPLGIIYGISEASGRFCATWGLSYFIGFFTCLIVQSAKSLEESIDDVKSRLNTTLLKYAANGNMSTVQALLDAGADVNSKSTCYSEIALIAAAEKGQLEVVKHLLENGADINAKDGYGRTALMEALGFGYIEIAKYLLEKNADVNIKDNNGRTALGFALDEEIMQFLKKAETKAM